jgi:hypothetical protein
MIMARSFPADPEIVWGGLLPAGPQEKVTALNKFPNEPQAGARSIRAVFRQFMRNRTSLRMRWAARRWLLFVWRCARKHVCHTFRIDDEGQEYQGLVAWVSPQQHRSQNCKPSKQKRID